MKKILILSFFIFFLTSCFWDSKEVIKAKKELGVIKKTVEKNSNISWNLTWTWDIIEKNKNISIKQISWEKILELDKLNYSDFVNLNAKITWKTLWKVDKIVVNFSNLSSDFPDDSYQLKKFKSWWKTFEYFATKKHKVIDYWLNIYRIIAFYWDKKSILELQILVEKEIIEKQKKLVWDKAKVIFEKLPKAIDFWHPVKLTESSFTYSDIKWLEVKKEFLKNIDCTKNEKTWVYFLTEFLQNRQNSYYYWNTCRNIIEWKWISFYLIRIDKKTGWYFYEKHYIDFVHNFYWVYEIEKWKWVDKYNISDKNKEFKEKNETFKQIEVVDNLFKTILK